MRRQARISAGGALVVRTASALQVWLWLLIFVFQNEFRISGSIKPGYLDFDNLPETNFTCVGKVIGGYYADLETSCQMFHVCTVGQQEEPMDIKFLCLNGTVFDQETRVCERVDEVDCTKSEKFYSLNLELYGSTIPPIIQPEDENNETTEKTSHDESDPSINESSTTSREKTHTSSTETVDSTDDPVQDVKKEENINPQIPLINPTSYLDHDETDEENQEEDEIDSEIPEYEDDYTQSPSLTTTQAPTTSTTTFRPSQTTTSYAATSASRNSSPIPNLISSPSPTLSSLTPPSYSSVPISTSVAPTLDPALLSPQEFIYHHRGPGSEAISFQRQGFRPADGVYITHAPQQQFDHFQYESSRTAPRPSAPRPAQFAQRPEPAPFKPTTLDPRDQVLRPGPSSQPSERHETSIKHKLPLYAPPLPLQRPFDPYYYDRKRSDNSHEVASLSARSVPPPIETERPQPKFKSPPRVIVTASASVSDSNGKRLNYTVGNVVSAVKPIVAINYDDYKESDLIFDPFFLDVPKLQMRRKSRSSKHRRRVFTIPPKTTISPIFEEPRVVLNISKTENSTLEPSRATSTSRASSTTSVSHTTTTTAAWNPNDYVDDNYEPHAYVPPAPVAVLITKDKYQEQRLKDVDDKFRRSQKVTVVREEQPKLTSSAEQTTSSQSVKSSVTPPPASPIAAPACDYSHSANCHIRE